MSAKKKQEITIRSSAAEYLTFISTIGDQPDSVELRYQDENIWLTQRLMAELYGVDVPTINYHIQQIYKDNELTEGATIRNFLIVQTEGTRQVTREVKHYSLQMIIAVWSFRHTSFRETGYYKPWVIMPDKTTIHMVPEPRKTELAPNEHWHIVIKKDVASSAWLLTHAALSVIAP